MASLQKAGASSDSFNKDSQLQKLEDSLSSAKARKEEQLKKDEALKEPWQEFEMQEAKPAPVYNKTAKNYHECLAAVAQGLVSKADFDRYFRGGANSLDERGRQQYKLVFGQLDAWYTCLEETGYLPETTVKREMKEEDVILFSNDITNVLTQLFYIEEDAKAFLSKVGFTVEETVKTGTPLDIFRSDIKPLVIEEQEVPLVIFHLCSKEAVLNTRNILENRLSNPKGGQEYMSELMGFSKKFICTKAK